MEAGPKQETMMRIRKEHHSGGALAFCASVIAILSTIAAGNAYGPDGASAAASLAATVAVIVGTKYAADNVRELRIAGERALLPILLVALRKVEESGNRLLVLEVHNAGAVTVIGLEASYRLVTQYDEPGEWTQLDLSQAYIRPNMHIDADLRRGSWMPMLEHLEVRVGYDSVLTGRASETWSFPATEWEVRTSGRRQ